MTWTRGLAISWNVARAGHGAIAALEVPFEDVPRVGNSIVGIPNQDKIPN